MSLPPPFDKIDHAQIARHAELLNIWRGLRPEELLSDLSILVQTLYFAQHRYSVLADAKIAHAAGATHDCGEWLDDDQRCQLCGRHVPDA